MRLPIFVRTICRTLGVGAMRIRAQAQNFYPSRRSPGMTIRPTCWRSSRREVIVVESFTVGEKEIAAAGSSLKFVQKYGVTTRTLIVPPVKLQALNC